MENTDDLELLLSQQQQLQSKIEELKRKGRDQAVIEIRDLASKYGLTSSELARLGTGGFSAYGATASPRVGRPSGPVAAKYRSATGETWSGRGKRPNWLNAALASGKNINEFLIGAAPVAEFTRTPDPEVVAVDPAKEEEIELEKDIAGLVTEQHAGTSGGKRRR